MTSRNINVAGVSLALLCLAVGLGQQPAAQATPLGDIGGLGGLMGGLGGSLSGAVDIFGQSSAAAAASSGQGLLPSLVGGVTGTVGGVVQPVLGALGSLTGGLVGQNGVLGGALHSTLGGISGLTGGDVGALNNNLRLATGAVEGVTSGLGASINGIASANGLGVNYGPNPALVSGLGLRNNFKREALADSVMGNSVASPSAGAGMMGAMSGAAAAAGGAEVGAAAAAASESGGLGLGLGSGLDVTGAAAAGGAMAAANVAANSGIAGDAALATMAGGSIAAGQLGRQAIAMDAMRNAQAESALAGAEMMAHGATNARSASLASNAYRQAKLASARDRVDIAGTIQNSARISDAAIATHDASIKAEDSLLGSELAVDSAATVLDSDAAYIPPVTSSLLRSLPYGRLGLRNIIPKPLTYPSQYLPDVWLNGKPVNYLNVPLRMYPWAFGPQGPYSTINRGFGLYNNQPFMSNNGMILNGMVYDPTYAYMLSTGNMNGALLGSSMAPILANGQLEAQDELATANLLTMQQLNGVGMGTTYQGFGRMNPMPLVTGTVSEVNLMPTTTIGTTYPIGSALVIEPRDSYFQDYNDNASSRQNFDERQQ